MKSFLSDRPSAGLSSLRAAGNRVFVPLRPEPEAPAAPSPAEKCAGPARARVECVREDGRVSRIIVTCACGEKVEVDCVYGQTPDRPSK